MVDVNVHRVKEIRVYKTVEIKGTFYRDIDIIYYTNYGEPDSTKQVLTISLIAESKEYLDTISLPISKYPSIKEKEVQNK